MNYIKILEKIVNLIGDFAELSVAILKLIIFLKILIFLVMCAKGFLSLYI